MSHERNDGPYSGLAALLAAAINVVAVWDSMNDRIPNELTRALDLLSDAVDQVTGVRQ